MSSTVEKIKERLTIEEVVGSYLELQKAGTYFKGRCPFHQEKSASFFVSPDRGTYYCFGCNAKGDILNFVEEMESLDFLGALKVLADRAGVTIERENTKERSEKERIFDVVEEAARFFEDKLKTSKEALLYLKNRGLSIESLKKFRIGFAPDEWRALYEKFSKEWSDEDLFRAGLIKKSDKGRYDTFRGRIMFPIFDGSGRVTGFSGRTLKTDSEEAKYLNSPETPIFEKSKILYGFNFAKDSIRTSRQAVLVEGQMDLVMSHQSGVENAVATSGTSFTYDHLALLKRAADTLIISFDSDNAGIEAAFRASLMAIEKEFLLKAAVLSGKDPADMAKENPEAWKKAVENAPSILDYFIGIAIKQDREESDTILKTKILPLLKAISNAIDQARAIAKISQEFKIPEEAIRKELSKISIEDTTPSSAKMSEQKHTSGSVRKALAVLFVSKSKDQAKAEEFKNKIENIVALAPLTKEEEEELYFEGQMHYGEGDIERYQDEMLHLLESEVLKERLAISIQNIEKAEKGGDEALKTRMLEEFRDISNQLSNLYKKYSMIN